MSSAMTLMMMFGALVMMLCLWAALWGERAEEQPVHPSWWRQRQHRLYHNRVVVGLVEVCAALGGALPLSHSLVERFQRKVRQAGYPLGLTANELTGLLTLMVLLTTWRLFEAGSTLIGTHWWSGLIVGIVLCSGTALLWLDDRATARRVALERELPGAIDLLVLCLGSGLPLAPAIEELERRTEAGVLHDHLQEGARRVRLGQGWAAALAEEAKLSGSTLFAQVTAQIEAARESGAPLGDALGALARSLRERRYRRAEQVAGEAPVKALLPLLFIFMACMGTVFGPYAVRFILGGLFS